MVFGIFLIFVACLQYLSGLVLLGRLDSKAVWPINLVVGLLGYTIAIYCFQHKFDGEKAALVATFIAVLSTDALVGALNARELVDQRVTGYVNFFSALVCILWTRTFWHMDFKAFALAGGYWAGMYLVTGTISVYGRQWTTLAGFLLLISAFAFAFLPGYLILMGNFLP